jgi:tRNA modification GTPase
MNQKNYNLDDTIVAISTALGPGGIGIVRLSGDKALLIVDQMFKSKNGRKVATFSNYTVHYGWVVKHRKKYASVCSPQGHNEQTDKGDIMDEALVTVMRRPTSYTREDVVEISCHGGPIAVKAVLDLAVEQGARIAEPGEFTKRAFLNGRIDLTQAEAVLDIIQAKTEAYLRISTHQLKGDLAQELENIREMLLRVYTELEAILNFPEEDIEEQRQGVAKPVDSQASRSLPGHIANARSRVEQLLETSEQGRLFKEGIRLVICGKPNVGKSSLLNALLRQPRAIVTEIAGTTRDTIEETVLLKGIPFQIVDTAGILDPRDSIEREAVKRSRLHMQGADLVILLLDGSQKLDQEDFAIIPSVKDSELIVVINKCDLVPVIDTKEIHELLPGKALLSVSALKKIGIEQLEKTIVDQALQGKAVDTSAIIVSNMRHITALKECARHLTPAEEMLRKGLTLELISEEIKAAIQELDKITGRYLDKDLLESIFSAFCIGK